MTPNTDIVIGFRSTAEHRTEEYMSLCVDSVVKNTTNYRFIFIDDNSDEIGKEFIDRLAGSFKSSVLIRTHFQHWFTRSFNLGMRLVRTPKVVLLNSDVIVYESWLDVLYSDWDAANLEHRVGLLGSENYVPFVTPWKFVQEPEFVTGHCWLVSMEALADVATNRNTPGLYLDETNARTIHIFSDNELCYALNKLNWGTVKCWNSHVDHVAGKSWGHRLFAIPNNLDTVSYKY
jgi:GT2 family glycosyltransferase